MKNCIYLLLVLLLTAYQAIGQQKQTSEENILIAMKDGSVIYPEVIKPITVPFIKPYLRINSDYRLVPEEVKYYKDGTTTYFWAEVSETGEGDLIRPAAKGRVSTYFSNTTPNKPEQLAGATPLATKPQYFQLENGPIRKITYNNLNQALTANILSMQKLQEVHKLNKTNRICLLAGGSMLLAGIAHSYKLNRNNTEPPLIETGLDTRISPLLLLGAVTLSVPLVNRSPAEKKLHEAIAIYNR